MKLLLITISGLFCVFTSVQCSSKKQPEITETQKRQLKLLKEIQERQKLTDDQMETSLERNIVVMNVMNQSIAGGLTTEEEMMNFPEKVKSLNELVQAMELDGATIALNTLKSYQSDKRENLEKYLRMVIKSAYVSSIHKQNQAYKDFKKDVDEHAKKDPLLQKTLKYGVKALK